MKRVGIDLGTTNTCATIGQDGKEEVLLIDSKTVLPSVFYHNENLNLEYVGYKAKQRGKIDPQNYIHSSKRKMAENEFEYHLRNASFTPTEVAEKILKRVYQEVVNKYQDPEIEAVITVPNNFPQVAIEHTRQAGLKANFKSVEILKEPIAAFIAYGEKNQIEEGSISIVTDFGGGTYDVNVIVNHEDSYEVIASGGNPKLGGDDFTNVMMDLITNDISSHLEYGYIDFSVESIDGSMILKEYYDSNEAYLRAKAKLYQKAEEAKEGLSNESSYTIDIPELYIYQGKAVNYHKTVTRSEFESHPQFKKLMRKIKDATNQVLEQLENQQSIQVNQISHVIYVGGGMNMPQLQALLKDLLKKDGYCQDLDTIVSMGACLKKQMIKKVIPKLNYALGIKDSNQRIEVVIPSLSTYPIQKKVVFTTPEDNVETLDFEVYEGNVLSDALAEENHRLGHLKVTNIPKAKANEPSIEVTFSLDQDGILNIEANDLKSNNVVKTSLNWKELTF